MPIIIKIIISFWWQILLLFGGLCLQVFANLQLPDIMADIINNGIGKSDMDYVWGGSMSLVRNAVTLDYTVELPGQAETVIPEIKNDPEPYNRNEDGHHDYVKKGFYDSSRLEYLQVGVRSGDSAGGARLAEAPRWGGADMADGETAVYRIKAVPEIENFDPAANANAVWEFPVTVDLTAPAVSAEIDGENLVVTVNDSHYLAYTRLEADSVLPLPAGTLAETLYYGGEGASKCCPVSGKKCSESL